MKRAILAALLFSCLLSSCLRTYSRITPRTDECAEENRCIRFVPDTVSVTTGASFGLVLSQQDTGEFFADIGVSVDAQGVVTAGETPGRYAVRFQGTLGVARGNIDVVAQLQPAVITLEQTAATSGRGGYRAHITRSAGVQRVEWQITNGQLTSSANSDAVEFLAGGIGTLTLTVRVFNLAGDSPAATYADLAVVAPPIATPAVQAPTQVTAGRKNVRAFIDAEGVFSWAIAIDGARQALATTANELRFDVPSTASTITLFVSAQNAAGERGDEVSVGIAVVAPGLELLVGTSGGNGYGDGAGANARVGRITKLTTDGAGTAYFLEKFVNFEDPLAGDSPTALLRRITPGGVVQTVAGALFRRGAIDGVGRAARFDDLKQLTAIGNTVFVYEEGVDGAAQRECRIRKVVVDEMGVGTVSTLLRYDCKCTGVGANHLGALASIVAVAPDRLLTFGLADDSTGGIVFELMTEGPTAGDTAYLTGVCGGAGGAVGPFPGANFDEPLVGAQAVSGNVFIFSGSFLSAVGPTGITGPLYDFGSYDQRFALLNDKQLVVTGDDRFVELITLPGGAIKAIAGDPMKSGDDDGSPGSFSDISALARRDANSVFVADTASVLRVVNGISATSGSVASVSTLAGKRLPESSTVEEALAGDKRLSRPESLVFNSSGNLVIAENDQVGERFEILIREMSGLTGSVSLAPFAAGIPGPTDGPRLSMYFDDNIGAMAQAPGGSVLVAQHGHRLRKILANGLGYTLPGFGLDSPRGLAVHPDGSTILISGRDLGHEQVVAIVDGIAVVEVVGCAPPDDCEFRGLAVFANTLYVADYNYGRIISVDLTTYASQVLAGSDGLCATFNNETPCADACLFTPRALAVSDDGDLFIGDGGNVQRLRQRNGSCTITTLTRPSDERALDMSMPGHFGTISSIIVTPSKDLIVSDVQEQIVALFRYIE